MSKPIYVLGTGLSHNGSAVLLKDGHMCVAIEKERITRIKHDGGNDTAAIQYCLDAEGITLQDVALVVQCANFEVPDRERFHGKRLFAATQDPPLVSISHHLAHAYSAAGTCHFDNCGIMVIDGCGSPYEQCTDLSHETDVPEDCRPENRSAGMWCEKDSFYYFNGQTVQSLFKDFSLVKTNALADELRLPVTEHSIGGFYAAVSHYVFGNMDDVGKLMGLAPFGKPGLINEEAFDFRENRLFVREAWKKLLDRPSDSYETFKTHFSYYADVAYWAQQEVEKAIETCFRMRLETYPYEQISYSGGVALNAVANGRMLNNGTVKQLYIEPAAGDNGLALGCAFYGWMEVLKQPKVPHNGSTCFGKEYANEAIETAIKNNGLTVTKYPDDELLSITAQKLRDGNIVGWFQDGCEFGPRALGHRSILAHPGIAGLGDHINANIKFREDFRPFAPATLPHAAPLYFESGRESPYMILVDKTKSEHLETLKNVTHANKSARVQTVDPNWNKRFYGLLEKFRIETGVPVLVNTSFNKKGQPIVETPEQAIALFLETAMDVLVIQSYLLEKQSQTVKKSKTTT